MSIKDFLSFLEDNHFSLVVEDEKLILKGDKKKITDKDIKALKQDVDIAGFIRKNKEELIQHLTLSGTAHNSAHKKNIAAIYRLSPLQEGILFHVLYGNNTGAYINQLVLDVVQLQKDVFIRSWQYVLKRHSILRSSFYYDEFKIPVQCVFKDVSMPVKEIDLREMKEDEQKLAVEQYIKEDLYNDFDLELPPLMRVSLLRISDDRYYILWTAHHLILDGWSGSVLMGEFLETYDELMAGKEPKPVNEDKYEDYIRFIERRNKEQEELYWRNYLSGIEWGTLLPFISSTTVRNRDVADFKALILALDKDKSAEVYAFAKKHHLTVNTIFQAVWAFLLYQYTGNSRLLFGVVVSGRPEELPDVEQRVGMYINTLPFSTVLNNDLSIIAWLQSIQQEQAASRKYQYTALNTIHRWTTIQGELFDSLMTFQNFPVGKVVNDKKWELQVLDIQAHEQTTNFPLNIRVILGDEIYTQFIFKESLLDTAVMNHIVAHFKQVLAQLVTGKCERVGEIRLITDAEEKQLTGDPNTPATVTGENTVTELFESQVAKTPDGVAVVFGDMALTYSHLNACANHVARQLRTLGVQEGSHIPVCLNPSPEMVIAIVGILKTGAAFVPIDPALPLKRIEFFIEDMAASVIVTASDCSHLFPSDKQLITVDAAAMASGNESNRPVPRVHAPESTAYVMYTSGSTGQPKGVIVSHKSLINYLSYGKNTYVTDDDSRASGSFIHLSLSFDASLTALFVPLLCGSKIVIPSARSLEVFKDPAFLNNAPYDFIKLTPAHLPLLQAAVENSTRRNFAKRLIVGGEALHLHHLQYFFDNAAGIEIINEYGPTEATVGCTTFRFNTDTGTTAYTNGISIGKPIDNVRIYILNELGSLCAIGVSGEIYISGEQLATGYWRRSALTAERFITVDLPGRLATRLYRTGDLGRWLPDGNIEYIGRIDEQVKIRGYRIELGEIENVLLQAPGVKQAAVVVQALSPENKRLAGFVVIEENYDQSELRLYLQNLLPEYMIPSLSVLEALPLTTSGKIDRHALAQWEVTALNQKEYVAPRTEQETAMASIWSELLEVEQVGIYDNFFDLGGHSLLAIQLISAMRKVLGREIAIKDIFDHPTIASLLKQVKTEEQPLQPVIKPREPGGRIPLSYAQERLWFVDKFQGSVQYYMPWVLRLKGVLNKEALEWSLRQLIDRHEVLRTVLVEHDGVGYQEVRDSGDWHLNYIDEQKLVSAGQQVTGFVQELVKQPINLSGDWLLQATLIDLQNNEHLLVVLTHHIVFDGWSMPIVIRELAQLYNSLVEGRPVLLPALPVQYGDYALWQRSHLSGAALEEKLSYWKEQLKDQKRLILQTDHVRSGDRPVAGAIVKAVTSPILYQQLLQLCREEGVTLYMLLVSVLKVLLYRYTGQSDISIGSPVAGRDQKELEGLIGFFVNMVIIRSEVRGGQSFNELLASIKETTLGAYAHQDVPYEKVVEALNLPREIDRNTLFDVKLGLHNVPESDDLRLGAVVLEIEEMEELAAQMDISMDITEVKGELHINITYYSSLYSRERMERMLEHYIRLLEAVTQNRRQQIKALPLLSAAEEQQLLREFSGCSNMMAYGGPKTITEFWQVQANKFKDGIALVYEQQQLSYGELELRANRLAHYLQSKGAGREDLVGLCMQRSPEMVIAMLGILKAGGVYVPIDPGYPSQRIAYMLEDSTCRFVITHDKCRGILGDIKAEAIYLDEIEPLLSQLPSSPPEIIISASHLAYVIYTSGSTGAPKGVMVEHGSVINLVNNQVAPLNLRAGIRVFQFASLSFDASCHEIFTTLLHGGLLVLSPRAAILDPLQLQTLLQQQAIELVTLPPSYHQAMAASLTVKTVLSAGEPLSESQAQQLMQKGIQVINAYGPTENTVSAILSGSPLHSSGMVTIGRPNGNVQAYILDEQLRPVPVGVTGELYLAGAQLARGYWQRPELTAERFIKADLPGQAGTRLYRTGDLGRWLMDGNIVYMGRVDEQVKIRGYRIEPGEIENVLQQAPGVKQCAVVVKKDNTGDKHLAGYIVTTELYNDKEVLEYAGQRLPEYMMPAQLITIDALPLTPSGKLDRRQLEQLEVTPGVQSSNTAPRTEEETVMASIWCKLLNVESIGIYDNFFALGGHSLRAVQLMSAIRKTLSTEISIKDIFDNPTIASLLELLEKKNKQPLQPAIKPRKPGDRIPLSYAQERLWFIDKLQGSVQYQMPWILRLKGALNKPALEWSLRQLIERHEVLRTVLVEHDGLGCQEVRDSGGWQLNYIEEQDIQQRDQSVKEYVQQLVMRPVGLSSDWLLQATLIGLQTDEHLLVVLTHHIAFDGWSMPIVIREMAELYNSRCQGLPSLLPDLPVQYGDYALWQRTYLSGSALEQKLSYWKEQLKDHKRLTLQTDYARSGFQSVEGANVRKVLKGDLYAGLMQLCGEEGVTLYMLLLSVLKVLLYRYTGQSDISIGSPVAGRDQKEIEGLIGFFVNTVVLRSHVRGDKPFKELLQSVKETTLAGYAHQDVPFEKVVEVLNLPRDMDRNALFDVKLGLHNLPVSDELRLGTVTLEMEEMEDAPAQLDISMDITEAEDGLYISISYYRSLYSVQRMERMLDHYIRLLEAVVKDRHKLINELQLLQDGEQQQLLEDFSGANRVINYEGPQTITGQLQAQVDIHKDAIALVYEQQQLSYGELEERSNRLAHYLQSKDVGREDLIGLCMERSPEMIIAMLGILKAGGAYVPIDPAYPAQRISYMLEDSACKMVISHNAHRELFQNIEAAVVYLNEIGPLLSQVPSVPPAITINASQLAYVIYTSGSTGAPKGVMIEHGMVVNMVHGHRSALDLHAGKYIFQFFSASFDASCYEIFCTLLYGGRLILSPRSTLLDAVKLGKLLQQHTVELVSLPPSFQRVIEDHLHQIKTVVSGGEPLSPDQADSLTQRGIRVVNCYGPTENTVCAALSSAPLHESGMVTIGKPIGNVKAYILDEQLRPVPIGVTGELYLAGAQLARGYWQRPALTAERFITADLPEQPGTRLYRTGDMGRWLADGNIVYMGRNDEQVKIRGYRIELGEIENVLQRAPGVQQCAVIVKEDSGGNKRLTGYMVTTALYNEWEVQQYAAQHLPEYMIPAQLITIDTLPLTLSGKIDRHQLAQLEVTTIAQNAYMAAQTEQEVALASIWAELLEVERVGIYDNFFDLGGHSLLAIQLISAMRKVLGKEVAIKDIFDYPTISSLLGQIEKMEEQPLHSVIKPREPGAYVPLSYAQERLWFIDKLQGSVQYQMPWILRLKGTLDKRALEWSFRQLINRHEILRTVLVERDGVGYQEVRDSSGWKLNYLAEHEINSTGQTVEAYVREQVMQAIDLSMDWLLQATLIGLKENENLLVVLTHHIAFDGWSIPIVVRELVELYNSRCEARAAALADLPVQYGDYALWQRSFLSGSALERKLEYWQEQLKGQERLMLQTDYARSGGQPLTGASVKTVTSSALYKQLQQLCREEGVTLYMLLLSVLKALLYRYTGQSDISIGSPVAGRDQKEIEGLIGFFINTVVIRSQVRGDRPFNELLASVKDTTLGAYSNQDVPFEKVVEVLNLPREMDRNALFDVKLALHNIPVSQELRLGEVILEMEALEEGPAQLDISMDITEAEEGLYISISYYRSLYSKERMERMLEHYVRLLEEVACNRSQRINDLQLLGQQEEQQLLEEFSGVNRVINYEGPQTITELLQVQMDRYKDAIALTFEQQQLSYGELGVRANRLAHYLQSKGVGREDLVGICMERSIEMIVAILGILKAGGAYVPIDHAYPAQRISYMLQDSACKIVVSHNACKEILQDIETTVVDLDEIEDLLAQLPATAPTSAIDPSQLAYVIYTSGSTGTPKGVMCEHRHVMNLVYNQAAPMHLREGIRVFQFSSISFDASCFEVLCTLLYGGRLLLSSRAVLLDPVQLGKLLQQHFIELICLPPSYQHVVLDQVSGLKTVISAGEPLVAGQAHQLQQKGIRVINAYGPSENTVSAVLSTSPLHESGMVVIGKPIGKVAVYLLDEQLRAVPVGVTGELYIGGSQLARGYWKRPELTAERFIMADLPGRSSTRLYRTGDLGRWLPDGNMVYMGRSDEQVKIRGYRIEPGEVENVLQQAPGVQQSAVIVRQESSGNKKLIGYIVASDLYNAQEVLQYAQQRLPDYMLPAQLITIEALPLTPSGKIDRRGLEKMEVTASALQQYVAPRTELEVTMASIWSALLEVERVGIYDNFFDLGGHSLLAIQLISAVRKSLNQDVSIKEIFDYPTIASLLQQLAATQGRPVQTAITRREPGKTVPLSYAQERLWFIDKLQGSIQYKMPSVLHLKGVLNREALEWSFRQLIDRHEVLRTVLVERDGVGYQEVQNGINWGLDYVEEWDISSAGKTVDAYIHELVMRPMDLSTDWLLQATLIGLQADEHLLVVLTHHIAFDGWSIPIVVKELVELYNSRVEGRPSLLPELPVQYGDYALWQRSYLSGETLERKLEYWKEQLKGQEHLSLHPDHVRSSKQPVTGASVRSITGQALYKQLQQICREEGVTLYMLLLSVLKVLLFRYTGQSDISIGSPVAGRDQKEIEGLIGFFVNTVVIRSEVKAEQSFKELLASVKETTLGAYEHQDVPFEKVVEVLNLPREINRNALFDVKLALHNVPSSHELRLGEVVLEMRELEEGPAQLDISMDVTESEEGLFIGISYYRSLYSRERMERMLEHYVRLLEEVVHNRYQRINELRLLGLQEEQQLLDAFSGANRMVHYEGPQTITALWQEQVSKYHSSIALVYEEQQLSYGELEEQANRLAHYLQSKGVGREDLVGICMERSIEMIVAILAILKAGGAYVPLDPAYPAQRISYMLQDSACKIVISHNACRHLLQDLETTVVHVDEIKTLLAQLPATAPTTAINPSQLAYVIYTSGSTGTPKGVMIEHGNVVNLVNNQVIPLHLRAGIRVFLFASLSFDASCHEIFCTILHGGLLVLSPRSVLLEPVQLEKVLRQHDIELITLPPSYHETIAKSLTVKMVLSAGEPLTPGQAKQLQQKGIRVVNAYGPTENTVSAVLSTAPLHKNGFVTIGKPNGNVQVYILDGQLHPVPVGATGELYLGGLQLARGYWQRPALTAERFIIVDLPGHPATRLYRTGDLGRWLPDGNLVYVGRCDEQVKIRGYRIEPVEIENVLQQAPGVQQCAVIARQVSSDNKKLIGYIVPSALYNVQEVLQYAQQRLPEYMVPAQLITINALPLTPSGKTDRRQLEQMEVGVMQQEFVAPRTELETILAAIWSELLEVERVGIYDNFFELGGHSLLGIRVISEIQKQLQVNLSVDALFQCPDIFTLARSISIIQQNNQIISEEYNTITL